MRSVPVVLLSNRTLLAAGIENLLRRIDGVELSVVSVTEAGTIERLRELNPEAIVLDSSDLSLGEGVVTRLLGQHPEARVVALALDPTGIEVYRVHRVVETDLDGLKEAIWGGPPPLAEANRQRTSGTEEIENGGL